MKWFHKNPSKKDSKENEGTVPRCLDIIFKLA